MNDNLHIQSVSFTIDRSELINMAIMPPNPTIINISSLYGDKVCIYYPLKYPSVSWRSWQDMGAVYCQIQQIFPSATLNHVERTGGTHQYTMLEFLGYFNKVMFPKPYYPQSKSEFMSRLAIYAQRLHFYNQLNYYSLVAMSLHFNNLCCAGFKYKECHKKTASILKLDRSEWKIKKNKQSNANSNIRATKKKNDKIRLVSENIHLHLRPSGKIDFNSLSVSLDISTHSLRRYVKEATSDHITSPSATNHNEAQKHEEVAKNKFAHNIQSQLQQKKDQE